MSPPPTHQRVQEIYRMLFEMATGNFACRIEQAGPADSLDELAATLNRLAHNLKPVITNAGYITPFYSYQSAIQVTFLLGPSLTITALSPNSFETLGYNPEILYRVPFADLLTAQSKALWEVISAEALRDKAYHSTIQLFFMTARHTIVPAFCTISRLAFSDKIYISTLTTILQQSFADGNAAAPNPSQSALIQRVHDYILENLEEPLPTARELARKFGTNEFRIKDGFRHFFNTGIYHFYNEERLKKAHALVVDTDIPLKSIAYMTGFNDYNNFYRAFRKKFGYTPSLLDRPKNEPGKI